MISILIILVGLLAAFADRLWQKKPLRGRHAYGQEGTYYVGQRQFVRKRLRYHRKFA